MMNESGGAPPGRAARARRHRAVLRRPGSNRGTIVHRMLESISMARQHRVNMWTEKKSGVAPEPRAGRTPAPPSSVSHQAQVSRIALSLTLLQ
jgi:hypothetical protein